MANQEKFKRELQQIYRALILLSVVLLVTVGVLFYYMGHPNMFASTSNTTITIEEEKIEIDEDRIENGIHVTTGLIAKDGYMTVVNNCTSCHSAKLVTQNRMNTERWNTTIKWMQDTQGLWDLGGNQKIIVNYLVENYPVEDKGRRENLKNINWYDLQN